MGPMEFVRLQRIFPLGANVLRRNKSDDTDLLNADAEKPGRSRLKVDRDKLEGMLTEFNADAEADDLISGVLGLDGLDAQSEGFGRREAKEDRRKSDRQSMEHLRADYKWSVAPDVSGPQFQTEPTKIFGRDGILTPVRMFGLTVALLSGGAAFYVATQNNTPEPAPEIVAPAAEIVMEPRVKILVARDTIAVGQRLSGGTIEWVEWPENSLREEYVTIEQSPDALDEMNANVARFEILPGEPIRPEKLVQADNGFLSVLLQEGMRGVSVPVSAHAAAGGFIRPNDHVDVVMTRDGAFGDVSETVLRNVRVLAINGQLGERGIRDGDAPDVDDPGADVFNNEAIATLALNSARSEVLINAAKTGSLALVLRSIEDFTETNEVQAAGINQSIRLTSPFWNSNYNSQGPR